MTEAPSLEDQPINEDAPEAPSNEDQPGDVQHEPESFADFDYEGIPDELRADVEKRIKGFQSSYTKATQSLAEERREAEQAKQVMEALRNPQVAPAVLAQLGYDEKKLLEMYNIQLEGEESDGEPDLYSRIDKLEGQLTAREQAEQQAAYEEQVTDYVSGEIEKLEKKSGREFSAEEQKWLDTYARAYAQNGVPDVEGAYGLLTGVLKNHESALLGGKRNTPRTPGNGKAGSRTVDLSKESKEERVARMAQAAEEAAASAQ